MSMQSVIRGSVYFALVFAVGFALGTLRVLWLAPALGERWAEIFEVPFMVSASYLAARFVVRRFPSPERIAHLRSGLVALALLLLVEFTVVLALRGVSLAEYLGTRDPLAGSVYVASLLAYAVMPWWVYDSKATDMSEDRTLRTSRVLRFSPNEIYGAFASADLLAAWWGPEGFTNTFETFEFEEGGRWQFVMHAPDGSDHHNESYFVSLVPDEKIVIRHDCPPHFTLSIEFTPSGDGTHLTWEQVFEDARTAEAVGRRAGSANEQNLDRLERALNGAAGGSSP